MRRACVALLFAVACGCGPEPVAPPVSADLATGEITLEIELRGNGGIVQILVTPQNDLRFVELTGTDSLGFAESGGGPEQPLVRIDGIYFDGMYVGQMMSNALSFDVVFSRGAERFISTVGLRPPFTLSGPSGPAPRSQPIPITWDAAAYPISLLLGGPCLSYVIARPFEQDPGGYEIQPADIAAAAPAAGSCDLVVQATRSGQDAVLAPELAPSSHAYGMQIRTLVLPTVP